MGRFEYVCHFIQGRLELYRFDGQSLKHLFLDYRMDLVQAIWVEFTIFLRSGTVVMFQPKNASDACALVI